MNMNIKQIDTREDAIAELMMKFCDGERAILEDEDAINFAPEIVAKIPPSSRSEYSEDVVIAAAQFADTYIEIMNGSNGKGGNGTTLNPQNGGGVASTFDKNAMPKVSDAEQKVIDKIIGEMDKDARINNTRNSKVTKYLYKNQPLAELLKDKATEENGEFFVMVHPELPAKTRTKIIENLVETEQNKKDWEDIQKLCAQPDSMVPAKLNRSLGRPEGVKIKNEAAGEGKNKGVEEIFNRERLISHLFFNTVLKIGSDSVSHLGVKVNKVEKKEVKKGNGKVEKASIGITFTGQKDIKPEYYEFINRPVKKADGTLETKPRSLSTELTVKIWVDRENKKTGVMEKKESTLRIRGKYECPIFERVEEFADEFGTPENKDFIDSEVTADDLKEAEEKTQFLLSLAATSKLGDADKFGSTMVSVVEQLKAAEGKKVDTADMGF